MTVPNNKIKQSFACNGSTVAFAFTNISYYLAADLDVLIASAAGVETVLTQNTDYTVTPAGSTLPYTAGTITLIGTYAVTPPATGNTLVVYRDVTYTQEIDLASGGAMPAATLEEGYDRAVMQLQQLYDLLGRTVTLPISSTLTGLALPAPDALKYLRWNATEDGLENMDIASAGSLSVSAFVQTLLDDADVAAFLTTLGLDVDLLTLSLPANTTISAFMKTLLDDTDAAAARATLEVGAWTLVAASAYTATPASTSTITMATDLTATLVVGTPLKYTIGGTVYYGIVSAIAANLLTIAGAPLGGDVTALYYGDTNRVRQVNVIIPGLYEDANNTDLIASDLSSSLQWELTKAYLVRYRVHSKVHDSHATHGQASVQINNTEVNTTAGGLTVAADATWYSTVVDIAVAAYDVNPGEEIEVTAIKGGKGDATDLTVEMTFVIP